MREVIHPENHPVILAESHVKQLEGAPNPRVNDAASTEPRDDDVEATLSEGLSTKSLINLINF